MDDRKATQIGGTERLERGNGCGMLGTLGQGARRWCRKGETQKQRKTTQGERWVTGRRRDDADTRNWTLREGGNYFIG
jgi:hypothetical protein